jgi:hypothetical protein
MLGSIAGDQEEPFGHLRDLLLLLLDESAEALDRLPRVLGRDARAVAVVAARAGGGEIRGLPEQVRRLRARSTTASWRASGRTSSRSSTIGASVSATDLSLRRGRASHARDVFDRSLRKRRLIVGPGL